MSADKAGLLGERHNFLSYALRLQHRGLLRRVVVDECHVTYTDHGWRTELAKLRNLRLLTCPLLLLTATLPPSKEVDLLAIMDLGNATRVVRAPTVQPGISYHVHLVTGGQKAVRELVVSLATRTKQRMERAVEKQRGIVYCLGRQQAEDLARQIGCGHYHSADPGRKAQLDAWLGEGGLITATSGLGVGVDFAAVTFVLHAGMPWSMTDYAQAVGRAARRPGEHAEAVIVTTPHAPKQRVGDADVQAMADFINAPSCRREVMSGYLDGRPIDCGAVPGAARCDRCGEGSTRWEEARREEAEQQKATAALFDHLRDVCVYCVVAKHGGEHTHTVETCHRIGRSRLVAAAGGRSLSYDQFDRQLVDRTPKDNCRLCWVSQRLCDRGRDPGRPCQWPWTVKPLVWAAALHYPDEVAKVQAQAGSGTVYDPRTDVTGYMQWLGQQNPGRHWEHLFTNAMVLVKELTGKILEGNDAAAREVYGSSYKLGGSV